MSRTFALALIAAVAIGTPAHAAPVGTSFSYQGEMRYDNQPANGDYDFEFALFDVETGGIPLAIDVAGDQPVNAGLFSTRIDYTEVPFAASQDYWLEVRVREGASTGGYQQLLPRQKVTPSPYAINARGVQAAGVNNAALADGAVSGGKIALDAVSSSKIVDGTIAAADVDATQVQHRVTGTCLPGSSIRAVDAAGAVLCQPAGSGTVTSVDTADGLTGGPVTATGTLSIADNGVNSAKIADNTITGADILNGTIAAADVNSAAVQLRVSGTCPGAIRQVNADGSTSCNNAIGTVRPFMPVIPPTVSAAGFGASSVTIGVDGLPLASFYAPASGDLIIVHCENVACTSVTATPIDTTGDVGDFNSIIIDRRGLGIVSYYDATNRDLKFAACLDIACTTATLRTLDSANDVGSHTSLALHNNGFPLIAYGDDTNGNLKLAICDDTCATPNLVTIDASANDVGNRNALTALDDFVVVAHHDATAGALKLTRCRTNATVCNAVSSVTADATATSGEGIAIARMANLVPVIFYTRNFEVRAIRCTELACSGIAPSNPMLGGLTPTFLSATRDALGYPIFVVVSVPNGTINAIRCADLQCAIPGLQGLTFGAGNPGFNAQPAMTLGHHGFPVITARFINSGGVAWVCDNHLCDLGGRER